MFHTIITYPTFTDHRVLESTRPHPTYLYTFSSSDRAAFDNDDQLLEAALVGGAWRHMTTLCQQCPLMHKEQFYKVRIHNLVTQFIINMPLRVGNRGVITLFMFYHCCQWLLVVINNLKIYWKVIQFINLLKLQNKLLHTIRIKFNWFI